MGTDSGHLSGSVWIGAAILGVFIVLQLGRLGRDSIEKRPLNLATLWISALIYAAMAISVIALQPPPGAEWVWLPEIFDASVLLCAKT